MRKPATTRPGVEQMGGEPKLPRTTSRLTKAPIGGKMGSAQDDYAGDTQLKNPQELQKGPQSVAIESHHVFGKRYSGSASPDGYRMHQNPNDMGRSQTAGSNDIVKPAKIPKQPKLKTPKI